MNKLFSKICWFAPKAALLLLFALLITNCISVKPIYNADEQAKAERAVEQFHKLYNEQNVDGLYEMFDQEAKAAVSKDAILAGMKESFASYGKIKSARLSQAKVFPNPPIQVRMIYNIEPEKGDSYQEWFVWVNRDDKAQLLQIQIFPALISQMQSSELSRNSFQKYRLFARA